jgi:hypothetical protein
MKITQELTRVVRDFESFQREKSLEIRLSLAESADRPAKLTISANF